MSLALPTTHRMRTRHDPEVGLRYLPGLRARIPGPDGAFYVVTNAQGFRSDVEFAAEPSGRPRALFFGDSFTAGDGCDNAERYPELAGQALGAEVYNYAVSGAGTDQQLLVYEKLARDVPADLIVLGIHVEDIERPRPYFTLDRGGSALRSLPVTGPRAAMATAGRAVDEERRAAGPLQRLVSSPLERLGSHQRLEAARAVVTERLPWLLPAVRQRRGEQPYPGYASPESQGWRLLQALLARFIEAARPTPVLLVPIPGYDFYHDGLEPLYQPLFERLEAAGRGVHVMDLTRPLRELPWPDRKRLALAHDRHFSPFGHEQIARAVVAAVQRLGVLDRALVEAPAPSLGAPMTLKSSVAAPPPRPTSLPAPACRPRSARGTCILGISAFRQASAAALLRDGEIVAAAEESRFSRVASDRRFPSGAANYCLEEAGIDVEDLAAVVLAESAPLAFERVLHTSAAAGLAGVDAWVRVLPDWLRRRLHGPRLVRELLSYDGLVLQAPPARAQAASAFYPSPFDRAAIVCLDGLDEWATGSIAAGDGREMTLVEETRFPDSLGLLQAAFARFTGVPADAAEVELGRLATGGEARYAQVILDELVDLKPDGSVATDLAYATLPARVDERLAALFGGPARRPGATITRRERDLARSLQAVLEEALVRTARHAHELTGEKRLCLAGSVARSALAGGRLRREGPFTELWIQPAADDASGALGAALDVYHTYFEKPRSVLADGRSRQGGSLLGPSYADAEILGFLDTAGFPYTPLAPGARATTLAARLAAGEVIGHFAGRLELGVRPGGARVILGHAGALARLGGLDPAEPAPAVPRHHHPEYHDLLQAFAAIPGHGALAWTSFNGRGEPVVCTPEDAYHCFRRAGLDALVLGGFLLERDAQPPGADAGPNGDDSDALPSAERPSAALTEALARAFLSEVLPAVSGLPGGGLRWGSRRGARPTTWTASRGGTRGRAGKEAFAVPPALDSGSPDPTRMAEAIAAQWEPGPATDALRRVLARLLEIARG